MPQPLLAGLALLVATLLAFSGSSDPAPEAFPPPAVAHLNDLEGVMERTRDIPAHPGLGGGSPGFPHMAGDEAAPRRIADPEAGRGLTVVGRLQSTYPVSLESKESAVSPGTPRAGSGSGRDPLEAEAPVRILADFPEVDFPEVEEAP